MYVWGEADAVRVLIGFRRYDVIIGLVSM